MTQWRAGMKAVCVDARIVNRGHPMALAERQIYTVVEVVSDICPTFGEGIGLHLAEVDCPTQSGFFSDRFRPLIDQPDDQAMIARIKGKVTADA